MAKLTDRIFFDKQDRDILVLVNRILEAPNVPSRDNLFNPELQNFYNLLTQPLHFSRFQASCWPCWMNPHPPKSLIYIDIA